MKKTIVLPLLVALVLTGCSSQKYKNVTNNSETGTTKTKEKSEETDASKGEPNKISEELTIDDLQFTEYSLEDDFGTNYLVAVKNNSDLTVGISANATAYSADNNLLGAASSEIDVLGPNEESVLDFYFSSVSGIDHIDYKDNLQFVTGTNLYYKPVISNLSVQDGLNGDVLTLAVTNNGDYAAEFVEAYAIFMDASGTPLQIASNFITDSNSEIAPGAMQSTQIEYYSAYDKGEYDHVTYYLTGRAEK